MGLAVLVIGVLNPALARRLPLGRLPGDVRVVLRGRAYHFPFTTTLLLSLLLSLVLRLL
ncbi:hypothetical protein OTERR_30800 [Oryzomicrobium terrae]|uniref:DUF2905 domain-containing protein n=1 Tax=Oryzomicrobium terrae TaxID=1735038 RepID=A0A5C1ECG9_9RHOO|nr:hypothetical protein OTERR_30800 [Oryzomicrobium terrae]